MALTLPALRSADGPQKILKAFKASLSDKAEGEIWTNVPAYVFGGQRPRGCNMAEYVVQEGVLHERALKSLRTVKRPTPDPDNPEPPAINTVFPESLRAFLLLEKSSLPGILRVSVLIQCAYTYDMVTVGTSLRNALSEVELRRIDRSSPEEAF